MQKSKLLFFFLLLFTSYPSVCAVLITPALPLISVYFGLTSTGSQLLIAIFLVGYTFGFLPYGPLANRYGRRRTSIYAVLLAIVGAILSMIGFFYKDLTSLYAGRLICGLGSSVGLKMAFTYISEVYPPSETQGRIAYMSLSFALAPSLAVVFGGYMTSLYGPVACFLSILLYSLIILCICFQLPETLRDEDKKDLVLHNIVQGYASKFKNRVLVLAALIMGSSTSLVYMFATFAPFIGIQVIGLTPGQYGYLNLIPPIGMIGGFMANNYMKSRILSIKQLLVGMAIVFVFSLSMLICFVSNIVNVYTLFLLIVGVLLGGSIIFANASSIAIGSASNKSNASAVVSFINMFLCSFVLFSAEMTKSKLISFLPLVFLALVVAMSVLWVALHKNINKTSVSN